MASKFLTFEAISDGSVLVKDRKGGLLGYLEYYPRWQQYILAPSEDVIWSEDCLQDVRLELLRLTRRRKERSHEH